MYDDYYGKDGEVYHLTHVKRWWVPEPVFKYLGPLTLLLGIPWLLAQEWPDG